MARKKAEEKEAAAKAAKPSTKEKPKRVHKKKEEKKPKESALPAPQKIAEKKHEKHAAHPKPAKPSHPKPAKLENVQPEINIGLVGHVDHGKTTLTERLTGKWTDTHSEEIRLGITIRLGYADMIIRKCPDCNEPECYTTQEKCPNCGGETEFVRKVSFIDAPGHESLMATMLSGATIIDAALLLVAANEPCPQPQTREHLMALQIVGLKNIIIIQNKIDLVSREQALKNYNEIRAFVKGTPYENAPIIPVSAQQNINIELILEAIQKYFPTPVRDDAKEPIMLVARSFDINKPGSDPLKMQGGVLGGTLKQGKLKVGDEIEMSPGRRVEKEGKVQWIPLRTKIISMVTGGVDVPELRPGGSIGVMVSLDPAVVKADGLAGAIVGLPGKLPKVWYTLKLKTTLLERVVGAKDALVVEPIKMDEFLMLNVNSAATVGKVTKLGKGIIECALKLPVCAHPESRVTISRRLGDRYRLIGFGTIKE
ncbi:translation initiation factor IF-2 subunit gamma [Candidatus Woesearchaeota archaeon CG07_land_8_20_14_0_80_44_23]|nr:MAG: translation initiation factor IF-2 subunit gamma [Candidatus Woesearchaeota archaeon CG07_land_8_20_14_0_80_44_23]